MQFTASSIMRTKLVTCNDTSTLKEVARRMIDEKVGSVLIKQNESLWALLIDRDILSALVKKKDFDNISAGEIMSAPIDYCDANDNLETCKKIFEKTKHSRLVVRKGDKVVGVLLRKFVERFQNISKRYSLAEIAHSPRFKTGRG